MQHQLQKLGSKWYRCTVCEWQWQSQTKTDCPGVPRYEWSNRPEHLQSITELKKQNLKPKSNPVAVLSSTKHGWLWLYDRNDCVTDNFDQPPVYTWDDKPDYLFTTNQLSHRNLKPLPDSALGVIWSDSEQDWVGLYSPISCSCIASCAFPPTVPKAPIQN